MPMPASHLSLVPLGESGTPADSVIAMIVEASGNAQLCADTYLPMGLNAVQARSWYENSHGYVVFADGEPAGVFLIHDKPNPGEGVTLPPSCGEIERWMLPRFRGQGLMRRVWPQVAAALATRYLHLVAVCWEDNHAAIASVRECGYKRWGRSFFRDESCAGWCEVWVYDLAG